MWESFFATLEYELLDKRRFKTQAEARIAVLEFIKGLATPSDFVGAIPAHGAHSLSGPAMKKVVLVAVRPL
jgi:hypothetical protein